MRKEFLSLVMVLVLTVLAKELSRDIALRAVLSVGEMGIFKLDRDFLSLIVSALNARGKVRLFVIPVGNVRVKVE